MHGFDFVVTLDWDPFPKFSPLCVCVFIVMGMTRAYGDVIFVVWRLLDMTHDFSQYVSGYDRV